MKKRLKLTILLTVLVTVSSYLAFSATTVNEGVDSTIDEGTTISLEECVAYAVHNSFEVQIAKLDLLIAETDKLYAEAVFDTIIFGNFGYEEDKRQQVSVFAGDMKQTNTFSVGVSKVLPTGTEVKSTWSNRREWVNTPFVTTNPSHNAEWRLEGTQPVGKNFFGYVDRNTVTVTKLAIMNSSLEMKNRIEDLIAKVEKTYWNLVRTKKTVSINRSLLERANALYETNSRNYDIGLIEKGDLLASEANVLIREKDLLLAENRYSTAQANLKLLMNVEEDFYLTPSEVFSVEPQKFNLVECLRTAFNRRRDYQIRKRNVKIQNINLKMKSNELWPEIDLKGTIAMNGLERKFAKAAGKTTVADNTYYYGGVEFTMPLENSQEVGDFRRAKHEKERAIVELKEIERSIITEVGNSYRDVNTLNASVTNMTEAVRLQAEKLKEEEKRYRYGRSDTKRLIDYQDDLRNAEMQQTTELLVREEARVDLQKEMGILLDEYERMI